MQGDEPGTHKFDVIVLLPNGTEKSTVVALDYSVVLDGTDSIESAIENAVRARYDTVAGWSWVPAY